MKKLVMLMAIAVLTAGAQEFPEVTVEEDDGTAFVDGDIDDKGDENWII